MNTGLEKVKPKGFFSTFSLNSEHKSRLENFINRNRVSPCKSKALSKSPLPSSHNRERSLTHRLSRSPLKSDFTYREEELLLKELELKQKEEQLIKLSKDILRMQGNYETNESERSQSVLKKKSALLVEKVRVIQFEKLKEAEEELNFLQDEIRRKIEATTTKRKNLQVKLMNIKEINGKNRKITCKKLCLEIVNYIISFAVLQSISNSEISLTNRISSFELALTKIKQLEMSTSNINRNLEKEALNILSKNSEICERSKDLQEKAENIEALSMTISKSEKSILMQEEVLEKREQTLQQKLKQIEALEKQIESKERAISSKEKKRSELTPERIPKFADSSFLARESIAKQKESELNARSKALQEKKSTIEEYKSKIKWRLNNIVSLEKKSENIKLATELKVQEFNLYVTNEEKIMEDWKEKLRIRQELLDNLKDQCLALEKEVKTTEKAVVAKEKAHANRIKEFDSVEEFKRVERDTEASEYDSNQFNDFAKSFQLRQIERRKEYEEISKEKKLLTEKISSILNLH